jgi:hypothetical protein
MPILNANRVLDLMQLDILVLTVTKKRIFLGTMPLCAA